MQKTASGCLITVEVPKQIATTERGPRGIWLTVHWIKAPPITTIEYHLQKKGIKTREEGNNVRNKTCSDVMIMECFTNNEHAAL